MLNGLTWYSKKISVLETIVVSCSPSSPYQNYLYLTGDILGMKIWAIFCWKVSPCAPWFTILDWQSTKVPNSSLLTLCFYPHQVSLMNAIQESSVTSKALNREVEPYGFFLVNALRKYHHALGRGLLPITLWLISWKCNQTKLMGRKCQNTFFLFY